ncbi:MULTISPECIES: hypothetical protein [Marinobacter]|uniref:hypothetical protein n=1 Tax=Marinobacter TaxID=2742 RepID=UPI00178672E3|nr:MULTISPECIES: hypothetical protein [Marinobacter]MBL3559062.1 hypothetical protein [Marinobacter sp. JB05H06]
MNEFKPEAARIDTVAVRLELPGQERYAAYVGLDVHKETIAVVVAEPGRQEPRSEGEIADRPKSIEKLVRRLSERFGGGVLQFVYEAEPWGYGLYHQLEINKLSAYSRSRLPLIPDEACHPFHAKAATDSTAKLPPRQAA